MAVAGESRTRVFTATWPAYAPATELAAIRADENDGKHHPGPFCQVEIRRAVLAGDLADSFSPDPATNAEGDLVFLERRLLLRSYNSVSLSDDGTYSLTLADCHGFTPISSSSSREQRTLPPPPYVGGRADSKADERGGYRGPAESIRLLFIPLPHSIEFSVKSGQVIVRGNQVVGNFHLLPVAHVPELQHGPLQATASSSNTATIDHAGHGQRSRRPQAWSETGLFQTAGAVDGVQACRNEYGGDSLGSVPPPPASSGGCFASGAVVGIMLSILSAWLVVSRGLGKESWERLRGRLAGANKRQAGRRQAIASVREAQKVQTGDLNIIGDGEPSEDGSSDSDAVLNGNVPEPVGLPRSEEDWRALFDTLYEDQQAADAADAREVAPLATEASDGQVADAAQMRKGGVPDSPL